eukprot:12734365-Ditylum_brightwellii.AAC.1
MDTAEPVNATQPDKEYENQLVWDNDLQEPIDNKHHDEEMEKAKEAGKKRIVVVNTHKEDNDIQEMMRERGEAALDKESDFKTDVKLNGNYSATTKNLTFALH